MTKYREILRLKSLEFSERNIALSCACSRNTVSKSLRRAEELGIHWPLGDSMTDGVLEEKLFPRENKEAERHMPDYEYVHKELLKNGVTKRLLWTEYLEHCRLNNKKPLMYSQYCYHIQQYEQKRRATMHIPRKPGEQIEVDWAGDHAKIIDPDTGETTDAHIFVGVLTYSQYAYVEAFINERQSAWITAHVHMYEYFKGVTRMLVSDNCKTAVVKNGWYTQDLNRTYHDMAEYYNTAILPARIRKPKDKPVVEGSVGNISTWITAALRNEQFFLTFELNTAIKEKLEKFNERPFQKKGGSRQSLFLKEELPLLMPLPSAPYELATWKKATVQYNYHISVDGMLYSVPYEYIRKKVDVRASERVIEVFLNQARICSHMRLYGRKNQYSTITEHMPKEHKQYLEWNGNHFREWADTLGICTYRVIDSLLLSGRVEKESYRACMGIMKLAEKHTDKKLEAACEKALSYSATPSLKSIKTIITTLKQDEVHDEEKANKFGITRGADYYGRK